MIRISEAGLDGPSRIATARRAEVRSAKTTASVPSTQPGQEVTSANVRPNSRAGTVS